MEIDRVVCGELTRIVRGPPGCLARGVLYAADLLAEERELDLGEGVVGDLNFREDGVPLRRDLFDLLHKLEELGVLALEGGTGRADERRSTGVIHGREVSGELSVGFR